MNQTILQEVKRSINLLQGMAGNLRKDELSIKEEIIERVIVDLDIERFLRYFFLPPVVSLNPEKEEQLLDYMARELAILKRGKELIDRRNLVRELIEIPDLKKKVEEIVKEGYNLLFSLEKREELVGAGEWRKDLVYLSEGKTREFIRINYQILKAYTLLVEMAQQIESRTDFVRTLKKIASQMSDDEYYKHSKEMIENMQNFGEARLCVRYDYFRKVQDVSSIKFDPKEKKIKETLSWYLKKWRDKRTGWLRFSASREESFYAEALDFLVMKNLSNMTEILTYPERLEFFLGGLRYIKTIESAGLPLVFPVFKKKREFAVKELYNPCLFLRGWIKIIPNDVQFDPKENVAIITGPNNSGKSVYVKSIGLAYCLAQNGFPIAARVAELSELKDIITHFVSPGDIAKGEGMYLDELRRIRELFLSASKESLLVVDEPIRGSSFEDAEEMSLRFIKGFLFLGAPTFLTTHLHQVSEKVNSWQGIRNLRTKIDKNHKPTYKIILGREKSYGVEIADRFGLTTKGILEMIRKRNKTKEL